MKYKWLLFDADGTLFDYDQAEAFALQNTFIQTDHSFEPQYLAEYRDINHQIWLDFEQGRIDQITLRTRRFDLLFEAIGLRYDSQEFSTKYLANLGHATHLVEGAEEIAKSLSKQCHLAIITNGGGIVATFAVRVEGVAESWVTISPPQVNLNEGERATVTVAITPPRLSSSRAGTYHVAIVVTSPNYPGRSGQQGASVAASQSGEQPGCGTSAAWVWQQHEQPRLAGV